MPSNALRPAYSTLEVSVYLVEPNFYQPAALLQLCLYSDVSRHQLPHPRYGQFPVLTYIR